MNKRVEKIERNLKQLNKELEQQEANSKEAERLYGEAKKKVTEKENEIVLVRLWDIYKQLPTTYGNVNVHLAKRIKKIVLESNFHQSDTNCIEYIGITFHLLKWKHVLDTDTYPEEGKVCDVLDADTFDNFMKWAQVLCNGNCKIILAREEDHYFCTCGTGFEETDFCINS